MEYTLREVIYRIAMHIIYQGNSNYRIMGTGTCYSMLGSIIRDPNSIDVGFAYEKASEICKKCPNFDSDRSYLTSEELVEIAKLCIGEIWPTRSKLYYKSQENFYKDYKNLCAVANIEPIDPECNFEMPELS